MFLGFVYREARARIMQIHSRKMNVSPDVNFEELSRSTDDFNGAQCKAVCVEAVNISFDFICEQLQTFRIISLTVYLYFRV